MEQTIEEILTSFSGICPLWNDDIWSALQSKRFTELESSLRSLLSSMPPEAWSSIYWAGIVEGIPSFCGELDIVTWTRQALPSIGKAMLLAGSPIKMLAVYASLNLDELKSFHSFLLNSIPGNNEQLKIDWLKENLDPLLVTFFLANPLGLNVSNLSISENQITRLKTIPEVIKNTLFSIQTPEIIKKIVEQNNLPQEKLGEIAKLVGLVLMGFIHGEELSSEINQRIGISLIASKALSDSINVRIFRAVQADLDKIYAPLPHTEIARIPSFATSQTVSGAPILKSATVANNNIVPLTTQANRLSDIGWSRSQSADPVVKLDISQLPKATAPAPTMQKPMDTIVPQTTSASSNPALGEFERLNAMKKGSTMQSSTPTGVPVPPKPPGATPAPFILHEDTGFSAAPKNASFKITQPDSITADQHLGSTKSQTPVKPAVLEFAGQAANKPVVPPTPPSTSNTIHYSEFQPLLSKMPTDNSGPRQVNQIMPPTNAAPATSIPVPRPPQPPKEKVVVQDFL